MNVIYEPKGEAREYAALACTLYTGCDHGCRYCYGPATRRMSREQWAKDVRPRKDILRLLAKDVAKLAAAGCTDEIFFSFLGDVYHPGDTTVTREALQIVGEAGLRATVLTKGGQRAIRDFDLLSKYGFSFGTSLVFIDATMREMYEPNTAFLTSRASAIEVASGRGIKTWVSLEPVIRPNQALRVIDYLALYVSHWKVGKINHNRALEDAVDWPRFLRDVKEKLDGYGADYYIKESLRKHEGSE